MTGQVAGFDADGTLSKSRSLHRGQSNTFSMTAVICFSMLLWYKFV